MRQTTFEDLARHSDPESSHAAAASLVASGRHARQMAEVLEAVRRKPGLTSDELAESMGVDRHVTGRRLPDLRRKGLVRQGRIRPSRLTGRPGVTWEPVA